MPNLVPYLVTTLAATVAITAFPLKSQALTFNFQFDNSFDGLPLDAPIVGTGTFSFDGDPGDGTFALTSLPNYNFFFDFGGDTFTNANIATPVSQVLVLISTSGPERFLKFSNINPLGSGPFVGSIDFTNPANSSQTFLSFEPPGFGGNLELYAGDSFSGTYLAVVPEPFTILGAVSAIGFGAVFKRKLKQD